MTDTEYTAISGSNEEEYEIPTSQFQTPKTMISGSLKLFFNLLTAF